MHTHTRTRTHTHTHIRLIIKLLFITKNNRKIINTTIRTSDVTKIIINTIYKLLVSRDNIK